MTVASIARSLVAMRVRWPSVRPGARGDLPFTVVLRDGARVLVRPTRPGDDERLRRMF